LSFGLNFIKFERDIICVGVLDLGLFCNQILTFVVPFKFHVDLDASNFELEKCEAKIQTTPSKIQLIII
jgi:hypothetical protein